MFSRVEKGCIGNKWFKRAVYKELIFENYVDNTPVKVSQKLKVLGKISAYLTTVK